MVATKKRQRSRPVSKPKRKRIGPSPWAVLNARLDAEIAELVATQRQLRNALAEVEKWKSFDQYDLPTVRRQRDECYARIAELAKMVDETTAAEAKAADRASRWERVAATLVKNASECSGVLHAEEVSAMVHAALKAEGLDEAVQP